MTKDLSVMRYECSLRDANDQLMKFDAYGMETITGGLSQIGASQIKKLFPHLPDNQVRNLLQESDVDVLIGMPHPSWHPDKTERAKGDGDFWIGKSLDRVLVAVLLEW